MKDRFASCLMVVASAAIMVLLFAIVFFIVRDALR